MSSTPTSAPSMASTASPSTAPARSLAPSLSALSRRFRGLPLAGVLLFTDGNRTDPGDLDWSPVAADLSRRAALARSQPGTSASARSRSARPTSSRPPSSSGPTSRPSASTGETVVAAVTDEAGKEVERQEAQATGDGKPLELPLPVPARAERGQLLQGPAPSPPRRSQTEQASRTAMRLRSGEQTLANNSRLVVVDQGGGPYRVLYVSGRPNWEFKFLRRAIDDDEQVQLVGLLRIARASRSSTSATHATRRLSPLSTASTTPTPTRPSGRSAGPGPPRTRSTRPS